MNVHTPILFCATLCHIGTHTPILGTGKTVIRAFIAHARPNLGKPCERLAVATVWVACAGLGSKLGPLARIWMHKLTGHVIMLITKFDFAIGTNQDRMLWGGRGGPSCTLYAH